MTANPILDHIPIPRPKGCEGLEPPRRLQWTPLYFEEIAVVGSNGFGIEAYREAFTTC